MNIHDSELAKSSESSFKLPRDVVKNRIHLVDSEITVIAVRVSRGLIYIEE